MNEETVWWMMTGARRRGSAEFRSMHTCPDDLPGTELRHYWQERMETWLTVIGPDLASVEVEYHRLWEERESSYRNPLKDNA